MASHHLRGNAIQPIHFFKIILQTGLERLKIPNMFTRRYGAGLSNPLFIKPPDGTEWKVYWTKLNGEVWFEKGWKEFAENYSLEYGHLVLFKYEGTSLFDVVILDQSSLEIDYPLCDTYDENDHPGQSDDESVQILNEWPHQKARERSPLFSPQPNKKIRGEKAAQRTSSLNWPRGARAREVAEKFISYNPFFTVPIKPVNLAENYLSVPDLRGVIEIENKEKYVKLQIGKRSWNVKLLRYPSPNTYSSFSAGFSLFATESELQPGDVCVFELINKEDSVFEVHVF